MILVWSVFWGNAQNRSFYEMQINEAFLLHYFTRQSTRNFHEYFQQHDCGDGGEWMLELLGDWSHWKCKRWNILCYILIMIKWIMFSALNTHFWSTLCSRARAGSSGKCCRKYHLMMRTINVAITSSAIREMNPIIIHAKLIQLKSEMHLEYVLDFIQCFSNSRFFLTNLYVPLVARIW